MYRATVTIRNANVDKKASTLSLTNIKLTYANAVISDGDQHPFGCVVRADEEALLADALAVIKSNVKSGDLNDDGVINLKDTVLLKKLVAGVEIDFFAALAADADGDGAVNVRDIKALKAAVAGN